MGIPRFWRLQDHNYRLTGQVCVRCGVHVLGSRIVCPHCHSPADWLSVPDEREEDLTLAISLFGVPVAEIREKELVQVLLPQRDAR